MPISVFVRHFIEVRQARLHIAAVFRDVFVEPRYRN